MTSALALMVLGFFLGMRHATDPDHVIAVTTIVAREKTTSGAAAIGAAWGFGHTLTILVVGGGIILFGWVIPPRIGLSMEFSVGLMLIVLGIMNLTGVMRRFGASRSSGRVTRDHVHPHSHGDYVHTHAHSHEPEAHPHKPEQTPLSWLDRHLRRMRLYRLARPLVVGVVHGLAGSAAIALLVLTTIRDARWGVWYLLVFGIGTIVGMMMMTAAIVVPFNRTNHRFAHIGGGLRIASGVISLGFGLLVAYRVGFASGLFTEAPHWTPQ
ncbi:MAG: sulfite exporter TauE/SafE family protein [Gemmatimonadota bacterium]|nr:sulfite exporter TauE/SafE family protein [Gemmatimonadota bacterium]